MKQQALAAVPELCYPVDLSFQSQHWTVEDLRQRLSEAAWVMRRMPMPRHGKPAGLRSPWPEIVQEWTAYGWSLAHAPRIPPTPEEITRLDEVLGWLCWDLTPDQRMVLWARANRWTWTRICDLDEVSRAGHGRTERWLRQIRGDGEARILSRLNGTPPRLVLDAV
jgi:Domain of unknown function (DUF6362)